METRLYLVRHGPTHQKNFTGWRDVPADLSDTAALARLSDYLPAEAILISSDLIRCVATADALEREGRDRLPHDARLRELHFGDWDGRSFDDVSQSDPELSRAYWETPGDIAPPNGESWNQTAFRVSAGVDGLVRRFKGRNIIVVTHFGAILTQLARVAGSTAQSVLSHKIDNLSVTELTFKDGDISAGQINHVL